MKNQKSLFKKQVLKTFKSIKKSSSFSITGTHNDIVFELVPLTQASIDDKKIITLLSRWRKKAQKWFPSQFKITDDGTKTWLQHAVLDKADRILFMIVIEDRYIGHVGLNRFQYDTKTADLDNIIRGVSTYPGLITDAITTMMEWGKVSLGIEKYTLLTHSDNQPALTLYKNLHFIETKRIPLKKEKFNDRTEWVEQNYDINAKKYNVYMELSKIKVNKKRTKKKISFVAPLYNEEENIKPLCKELIDFFDSHKSYDFEAVLVENGSYDNTFKMLEIEAEKDKRIKILQLAKNELGDGGMAAGMQYIDGDACVIIMGDLQEPVQVVEKFLEKWHEGYDIVYGIVKKRTANWLINICSKTFYKLMSMATANAFPENVSDFRLIDKRVYQAINQMPEKNKYLRGLIIWTGFSHTGVVFNRRPRIHGEATPMHKLMKVAFNGIFSFSYLPLRFVSILGLIITVLSFVGLLINLILLVLNGRQTPGIATVILLMFTLFGILFFIIGILSEYIARIYEEVKRRPNYIVKNVRNLPHLE